MYQVTCMHDRDEQCCHECEGGERVEYEKLKEIEEDNMDYKEGCNKHLWIYVEDDLPEIQNGMERVSIDVTVETNDGEQHTGFYSHGGYQWYIYTRTGVQEANVVRWALIGGKQ